MPMALSPERPRTGITRLTGGRLVKGDKLVEEDLWISSVTGKILRSQEVFYEHHAMPDETVDLKGKILCPGFIDVQFNGAFGFDFSTLPDSETNGNSSVTGSNGADAAAPEMIDMTSYQKGLNRLNKLLVRTGVTSYLPTLPSQTPKVYHNTLPLLGPSGQTRDPSLGSESLGAHCEGPFISPTKNGIHSLEVLRTASTPETPSSSSSSSPIAAFETCYGPSNLPYLGSGQRSPISLITAAPEVPGVAAAIPALTQRGIKFSVGHTESTFEETSSAIRAGATMITHLFNAMRPLHHRNPGPFGTLGKAEGESGGRPFFGVIADGIHLHPTTVKIAYNSHPKGFILVTDAMKTVGLPDGVYDWTNGDRFEKKGSLLTRVGSDTIAGSSATLVECVNNFWNWSHAGIPDVIRSVTAAPAEMLGLGGVKGCLSPDADADLLVLDTFEEIGGDQNGGDGDGELVERRGFTVEQVWKFGSLVFDAAVDQQ